MNDKRDAYVQARVTPKELAVIESLARRMRRSRSDTLRVLALEKAETLGLLVNQFEVDPQSSRPSRGEAMKNARDAI